MFASHTRRSLLFCLAAHVFIIFALPNPSRSSHAIYPLSQDAIEDSVERGPILARMDGAASAVMAADIPTATQQSQDITGTDGMNGTHPDPGVIPNLSITREAVNCSDPSTGRDNKCWQELQLTTWLENWIVGSTCYQDEPFVSCFLRQVGYPELDCTGIKLATCTPPPFSAGMDPRAFYVAYNFYGMFTVVDDHPEPRLTLRLSCQPVLWVMVQCRRWRCYVGWIQRRGNCAINRPS